MRELRPSTGPFADCTKGEHRIEHRLPGVVPSACRQGDEERRDAVGNERCYQAVW
ncbi:hypothetical protein [Streptomyces sp. NPDC059564]|uniref:hypothetical protein n=1 Tax=Streptomyces sp. NPDC059564 TaxID=3346865 RepID=UPI0036A30D28